MTRLNKFHITLTGDSKINLLKEYGKYNMDNICKDISSGKDGKLNGDNLDIYVHTNDIRMQNSNKDYHFFASDWTPYRLTNADFQNHESVKEVIAQRQREEVSAENFLVKQEERELFLDYLSVILGRVMMENCEHFKWLNAILPKHFLHKLSDVMSRKTTSHVLPIMLKNESNYDDCISILDSYMTQLKDWYNKAGRGWNEMKDVFVTV
jgi:hypothetical protein